MGYTVQYLLIVLQEIWIVLYAVQALDAGRLSLCNEVLLLDQSRATPVISRGPSSVFVLTSEETTSFSSLGQNANIYPLSSNNSVPEPAVRCVLEISACAVCQLRVSWNYTRDMLHMYSPCLRDNSGQPCLELELEEDSADRSAGYVSIYKTFSILENIRQSNYTSTSYKLKLILRAWNLDKSERQRLAKVFPLRLTAIDNGIIIVGKSATHVDRVSGFGNSSGFITTPRYPDFYPDGVTINYTLINDDVDAFVRLIFVDYMLHYMSILKIYDSDGKLLLNTVSQFGGSTRGRPAPVVSIGHKLTIVFTANHYTHEIGFRAQYIFVDSNIWPEKPKNHECDKVLETSGGSITIPGNALGVKAYIDCVWVIGKTRFTTLIYDRLYIKVEDFQVKSNSKGIQLQIREGKTSVSPELLDVWGPQSPEQLARDQPQEGFLTSLSPDGVLLGFYVRIRGYLDSYEGIRISWAHYYSWASALCSDNLHEFHCANGRCIPNEFKCDGANHCGDFSDEKGSQCAEGNFGANDINTFGSKRGNVTLSGYTTTILLIAGLVGLTLVMLMVTILVARVYRHRLIRRLTREHHSSTAGDTAHESGRRTRRAAREETETRTGPSMQRIGDRRYYVMSDPQINVGNIFEAPPTYDDALKHPSVPPNQRLSQLSAPSYEDSVGPGAPPHAFDNPGFTSDSSFNVSVAAVAGPSTSRELSHSLDNLNANELSSSDTDELASCTSASVSSMPQAGAQAVRVTRVDSRSSLSSDNSSIPARRHNSQPEIMTQCNNAGNQIDNDNQNGPSGSVGRAGGISGIIQWAKHKVGGSKGRRGSRDPDSGKSDEEGVEVDESNVDEVVEHVDERDVDDDKVVVGDDKVDETQVTVTVVNGSVEGRNDVDAHVDVDDNDDHETTFDSQLQLTETVEKL